MTALELDQRADAAGQLTALVVSAVGAESRRAGKVSAYFRAKLETPERVPVEPKRDFGVIGVNPGSGPFRVVESFRPESGPPGTGQRARVSPFDPAKRSNAGPAQPAIEAEAVHQKPNVRDGRWSQADAVTGLKNVLSELAWQRFGFESRTGVRGRRGRPQSPHRVGKLLQWLRRLLVRLSETAAAAGFPARRRLLPSRSIRRTLRPNELSCSWHPIPAERPITSSGRRALIPPTTPAILSRIIGFRL